jgi:tetratricopeptide (TPR) repeat protein
MPRSLDEANGAVMRVRELPFGSARNEVAASLVREITSEGPQEAQAFALFALTESYAFSEEVEKAYLPFTQSVRLWDTHPELFDEHDVHSLFWSFKWMVGNLMSFPSVPAEQITSTLDDMRRRYRLAGNGLSAVNHLDFQWHHMLGDAGLPAAYDRWVTTERDDFSQCPACEPGDRTAYLFEVGRYEEGIRLLETAEEARASCRSEPADRLSQLQLAYLEVGDAAGAARAHRRGLQTLGSSGELAGAHGRHVQLLARSQNTEAAHRFLAAASGLLTGAETPADRLAFLCEAGTGVSVLRRREPGRPVSFTGVPVATVAGLDDWMHAEALALAAAFDARGGTSAATDRVLRAWSGEHSELEVDLSVLPDVLPGTVPARHDGPGDEGSAPPAPGVGARAGVGPDALVSAAETAAAQDEPLESARLYAQAADLFVASGEAEAAGFALAEAAALSRSLGDVDGAARTFRSALAMLDQAGTGVEYTGPVVRAYARARADAGTVEAAWSVLGDAVRTARRETDAARGSVAAVDPGAEGAMAQELARRAHRAQVLAAEHAQLLDTLARSHAAAGRVDEAVTEATQAAEAFAGLSMVQDAGHSFWLAGRLRRGAGRLEEAVWLLESAVEGFTIARDRGSRAETTGELVEVLTALGRVDEAQELVRRLAG